MKPAKSGPAVKVKSVVDCNTRRDGFSAVDPMKIRFLAFASSQVISRLRLRMKCALWASNRVVSA